MVAPVVTAKFPAPEMLAEGERMAVPLTLRRLPGVTMKLPVLSPTVRASVPLLTSTLPELLQGMPTVVVPEPVLFRRMPALRIRGLPRKVPKAEPSAWRSRSAAGALLKTALLMQVIWPPLQVATPLLSSVPPLNDFTVAVLIVNPPLAITSRLEPALPIVPAVHVINPETASVIFPSRLPEERLNEAGVIVPVPLNTTVPPLMTMGPLVIKQLP